MVTDGWQLPYSLNLQFCFWQTHWFYDPQYIADEVYLPWYIFKIRFRKHTICWNTLSWKAPVFPRGMQRRYGESLFFPKRQAWSARVRQQIAGRSSHGKSRRGSMCGAATLCLIELLLGFINTAGNTLISSYWGQKKIKRSYFDFLSSLNEINGFKSFSKMRAVEVLFAVILWAVIQFWSAVPLASMYFFFSCPAGLQWRENCLRCASKPRQNLHSDTHSLALLRLNYL